MGDEERQLKQSESSETFSLHFLSLNKLLNTFSLHLKHCSAGIIQVVLMDSYRMCVVWPKAVFK